MTLKEGQCVKATVGQSGSGSSSRISIRGEYKRERSFSFVSFVLRTSREPKGTRGCSGRRQLLSVLVRDSSCVTIEDAAVMAPEKSTRTNWSTSGYAMLLGKFTSPDSLTFLTDRRIFES